MCVLYLLLYVDDILIASANKEEIIQLKESLNIEFEMKESVDKPIEYGQ